ncbi:MAG: hypothetical protein AAF799_43120 [Myxococcota bacterium]
MIATRTTFAAMLLASTVATGCDAWDQGMIGPEGGVVVSEDGRMALEIPAGALDETVDISIERLEGPQGAAGDLYVVEPIGLTFATPAIMTFDYDDETLGDHDAEALSLVAQREASWAYLGDQLVDGEDQTVSASLMALSPVTVVVED